MQQIIVQGNPVDGFTFYGPFENDTDAMAKADREVDPDWWVADLRSLPANEAIDSPEVHARTQMLHARDWITGSLRRFFEGEISNERNGGTAPATLTVAIDSLSQGGTEVFGLSPNDVIALLNLRDMLPGETTLHSILSDR